MTIGPWFEPVCRLLLESEPELKTREALLEMLVSIAKSEPRRCRDSIVGRDRVVGDLKIHEKPPPRCLRQRWPPQVLDAVWTGSISLAEPPTWALQSSVTQTVAV